jgi:hypothetical protein
MAFAYDTPISCPSGDFAIQRLQRGDQVMAASLRDGGAPVWEPTAIVFSDGVAPGGWSTAMFIEFDDRGRLICLQEQIFLEADGQLTSARRLHPGRRLVRPDGSERLISAVSWGRFEGGLHNVATGMEYRGSPDSHLIAAGGVMAGDFLLVMNHRNQAGPGPNDATGGEDD